MPPLIKGFCTKLQEVKGRKNKEFVPKTRLENIAIFLLIFITYIINIKITNVYNIIVKKIKFLLSSLSCLTLVNPMVFMSSCALKEEDKIWLEIYDEAINQFNEISKIPHCSNEEGHETSLQSISNYVYAIGQMVSATGTLYKDKVGNVWFDIPASLGYEKASKIVLHSHLDMTWDCIDQTKDKWTYPVGPLEFEETDKGTIIHSQNYETSLGLCGGSGTSLMLSLALNSYKFNHGPIRFVFTVNAENNAIGIEQLGTMSSDLVLPVVDHSEGYDWVINLDNHQDDTIIVGQPGKYIVQYEGTLTPEKPKSIDYFYEITIDKHKMEHSGYDIHKNIFNPIYLAFDLVDYLNANESNPKQVGIVNLKSFGVRSNEDIPSKVVLTIRHTIPETQIQKLQQAIEEYSESLKTNPAYDHNPEITCKLTRILPGHSTPYLSYESSACLSAWVKSMPNGFISKLLPDFTKNSGCFLLSDIDAGNSTFLMEYILRGVNNIELDTLKEYIDALFDSQIPASGFSVGRFNIKHNKAYDIDIKNPLILSAQDATGSKIAVNYENDLEQFNLYDFDRFVRTISIGPKIVNMKSHNEHMYVDSYQKLTKNLLTIISSLNI